MSNVTNNMLITLSIVSGDDDRFVQSQIRLMQTEARVNIESRVKVWIKKPSINLL